jgi:hypothetical protein
MIEATNAELCIRAFEKRLAALEERVTRIEAEGAILRGTVQSVVTSQQPDTCNVSAPAPPSAPPYGDKSNA